MTVSINAVATLTYLGTNTASVFSVAFPTFENVNVEVYAGHATTATDPWVTNELIPLDEGIDYTLTAIGRGNYFGTLSLINASQQWLNAGTLKVGWVLFIKFTTKPQQPSKVSQPLENVVDRHTMNINALREDHLKCVKFNDYSYWIEGKRLTAEEILYRTIALEDRVAQLMDLMAAGEALGGFTGFSARFSEAFNTTSLYETVEQILQMSYLAPSVSLSASGSGIREKGDAVTASTLTATVTKKSDSIAKIEFFLNNVLVAGGTYEPPANTGSGATVHNWTGSFSDTATFKVEVTDDGTTVGGPSTVTASVTFNFVYPYYYGAGPAGKTPAQVAALTKDIIASTATKSVNFTTSDGDVYYFAYPASYGALTQVLDISNFDTLSDWNLTIANITGLDGNPVSYRIYEFVNPVVAGSTTYIFKR